MSFELSLLRVALFFKLSFDRFVRGGDDDFFGGGFSSALDFEADFADGFGKAGGSKGREVEVGVRRRGVISFEDEFAAFFADTGLRGDRFVVIGLVELDLWQGCGLARPGVCLHRLVGPGVFLVEPEVVCAGGTGYVVVVVGQGDGGG